MTWLGQRGHTAELWRLAWPLALVQLNNNLTGAVDTALAGRVDQATLAATGLGASLFSAVSVLGTAAGLGIEPLVAQAFGRGDAALARRTMWRGLALALLLCVPLVALALMLACGLERVGVDAAVSQGARHYVFGRALGLPTFAVVMVMRSYLQAARLTRPILISSVAMNIFNVIADWLFLFGDDGLTALNLPELGCPSMGPFGLGLASGLAAVVQLGVLALAVAHVPKARNARTLRAPWANTTPPQAITAARILGLGTPAALQILAEVGIFSTISLLMGRMGAATAAAHQAAIVLVSLSFSICVGIGSATCVQVGRHIGRGNSAAARQGAMAGMVLVFLAMGAASMAMWWMPRMLIGLMTTDQEVAEVAIPLLRIAGVFQLADGVQAVAAGALRGAGRTRFAFGANVVAHWAIGLPLALFLSRQLAMGPQGLWWGLVVGLVVVAVALCGHFFRLRPKQLAPL